MLLIKHLPIFEGQFTANRLSPIGLLLYKDGSMYFGQHSHLKKHGIGMLKYINENTEQGTWHHDRLHGSVCKVFIASSKSIYFGPVIMDRIKGIGAEYDGPRDEVYEGPFIGGKRHGTGIVCSRDGSMRQVAFQENLKSGNSTELPRLNPEQTKQVFQSIIDPESLVRMLH